METEGARVKGFPELTPLKPRASYEVVTLFVEDLEKACVSKTELRTALDAALRACSHKWNDVARREFYACLNELREKFEVDK